MRLESSAFAKALVFAQGLPEPSWELRDGVVRIGSEKTLSQDQKQDLLSHLRQWRPWRKGPFSIYGLRIDANWKSDRKWRRLRAILEEEGVLKNGSRLRVCDVGCNNGYFLFALESELHPVRLIGLDPTLEFRQCFRFLQELSGFWKAEYLPYGFQELKNFLNYFDLIVCMGVLYHHSDPMSLMRLLHGALAKGGLLVLETLCLPEELGSEEPHALIPEGRYAGMRGVWQVPNQRAVRSYLKRSGFGKIRFHQEHDYTKEQVRTEWGDLPGLSEMLDPSDPRRTREGYPAPGRAWLSARKHG